MLPRLKLWPILLTIFVLNISCKPQRYVRGQAGYVVGPSDDIELYHSGGANSVKLHRSAAVLIFTELAAKKRKFCSGIVISTDDSDDRDTWRILTNYHCFANVAESGEVARDFLPEACTKTSVVFGADSEGHEAATIEKCAEGSLTGEHDGDLATFYIKGTFPTIVEAVQLWDDDVVPAERAGFMIHHPDVQENYVPMGKEKIMLPAAAITENDCTTKGDFSPDEWRMDDTLRFSFKHTCDLKHGSSGSGLIDQETGRLLGVNWGGVEFDNRKAKLMTNGATSVQYVRAFLAGNTDAIKADRNKRLKDFDKKNSEKNDKVPLPQCGVVL